MLHLLNLLLSPRKGDFEEDCVPCSICGSQAKQWPTINCSKRMYKSNAHCSNIECEQYIVNYTCMAWNVIQDDIIKNKE